MPIQEAMVEVGINGEQRLTFLEESPASGEYGFVSYFSAQNAAL
jgi:hypothetical protein